MGPPHGIIVSSQQDLITPETDHSSHYIWGLARNFRLDDDEYECLMQLGLLTNLRMFNLHHNRISGEIPRQLTNLTEAQVFYLSGNRISGTLPEQLGNLTALRELRDELELWAPALELVWRTQEIEITEAIHAKRPAACETQGELLSYLLGVAVGACNVLDADVHPSHFVAARDALQELKEALSELAKEAPPRSMEGVFRMPVQRVFSAKGFGTIVTGIPVSGAVKIGESLELQPGGLRGKVRGIQAYHEQAETARAGHSTAINLSDVRHDEVERGFVLSTPGFFEPATMFGAQLEVIESSPMPVSNRLAVRVHTGTTEAVGEVIVLDAEDLAPGSTGLVQLRLETALVAAPGDRFVLRLASPSFTLGGGVLIERSRHRLKRFKQFALDELQRQSDGLGSVGEFLEVTLARRQPDLVPLAELAVEGQRSPKEAEDALTALEEQGLVRSFEGGKRWVHSEVFDRAVDEVCRELDAWFGEHPWRLRPDPADHGQHLAGRRCR